MHMEVRTPHEIENEVGLTEGNIFQGELTIDQLLFNRPFPGYGQYRMPVRICICVVLPPIPAVACRPPVAPMRPGKFLWT